MCFVLFKSVYVLRSSVKYREKSFANLFQKVFSDLKNDSEAVKNNRSEYSSS